MRHTVVIVVGILLSGCAAATMASGAFVGAVVETGSSAFQAKVEERAAWRTKHLELTTLALNAMLMEAGALNKSGEHDRAMAMYRRVLDLHEEQHPKFLIEKLMERRNETQAQLRD